MSSYHVLSGSDDGNAYTIVMHIAIPNTNNRIGTNHRAALIAMLGGTQISRVPGLAGAGQTELTAGSLYEHIETIATNPGENSGQYQTRVDAIYSARVTQIQTQLQNKLAYWGHSRDVV